MITAYIGLGANLDDPLVQLVQAIDELAALQGSHLQSTSSFYRSPPMVLPGQSPEMQPDYINAVAQLQTSLTPHALLDELQAIEQAHGRQRNGRRWGPRTLDLDILLYGNQQLNDERLQVPHAGMAVRNFVLYPLQELVSEPLILPGMGRLVDLLERCSLDGLEKITL